MAKAVKKPALKVDETELKDLFKELGFKPAVVDKWNDATVKAKIDGLPEHSKQAKAKTKGGKALLASILDALENGTNMIITDLKDDDEEEVTPKKATGKKGAKAVVDDDDDEEIEEEDDDDVELDDDDDNEFDLDTGDDDEEEIEDEESDDDDDLVIDEDDEEEESDEEEVEDEDEEVEEEETDDDEIDDSEPTTDEEDEEMATATKKSKKPAGKTATGKKGAPVAKKEKTGPGKKESIVEFLQAASKEKPLTKAQLVSMLMKRFPGSDEESTMSTVSQNVPTKLRTERSLDVKVVENSKGIKAYYIPSKKSVKK